MADRTLDTLMPQALALVAGVAALSFVGAGVAADVIFGRLSSTAAFGIVAMFPLALFAAIVGFALGHYVGYLMRKAHIAPSIAMKPYRLAMGLLLALVIVAGATLGATPVLRNARLHEPRVIAGADFVDRREGAPEGCVPREPAPVVCEPGQAASAMSWNARDVTVSCTREGLITVADQSNAIVASLDLTPFERMRLAQLSAVRQPDGREGLVVLAQLRTQRDMFAILNPDGQVTYQELVAVSHRQNLPLSICRADDGDAVVVDLGSPVTYRAR